MQTSSVHNLNIIKTLIVKDIRAPIASIVDQYSDQRGDPVYSAAYVSMILESNLEGNGIAVTHGNGTEIIVRAVESLKPLFVGKSALEIYKHFSSFYHRIINDSQLYWLGPSNGVMLLAIGAIFNALWDLWAKISKKPLWKLLVDMPPEELISTLDFKYVTDALTHHEAIDILQLQRVTYKERQVQIYKEGYPAITREACRITEEAEINKIYDKFLLDGFKNFKVAVGTNVDEDCTKLQIVRKRIGWENRLVIEADQMWEAAEASHWVKRLKTFRIFSVEEPISPDDYVGYAAIQKSLGRFNINVATGALISNKVMVKQHLLANGVQILSLDITRLGGINEVLTVYLMAHKYNVKICPRGNGLGLAEMAQHLQIWDFISVSGSMTGRYIEYEPNEYVEFVNPVKVKNGNYIVPHAHGFSTTLTPTAIAKYEYPTGSEWKNLRVHRGFEFTKRKVQF